MGTKSIFPFHQSCSPGKPATESSKYNKISLVYFMFKIPKTKRNCCRGGISITLNVQHHFICTKPHSVCSSINDPFIGLVRNKPCNVIAGQVISFEKFGTNIGHSLYSKFEHRLTILVNKMFLIVNRFYRSRSL